ncbi:MAG: hypothetical protein UV74_C0013G0394 [Candidatus Woesebacteria bacterium GW2011_GWB1_43_14]|uniref:Glycosyltransferase RgtA/B/C/D-like domain-containing protein n=1 Tax=Candidatus Woesebacteria bacterium GW2011_GWB1_43_14 TaxID=1618578 RepID=A0A0G1DI69_9BACT|nr:MAG: hypothetical protein UT21_C0001G0106 [Candidatus Woesebacteria bacterium GW2011_GWA1_39_11b]KKS78310.1 MAG: hypothetical protein UV51_C0001G0026 [Candidatus Woesebacteria bacterium GW2011_GWC1_42_9]KKS97272.1 MAG: hypothetical protein UV74_C0013G0394 [Candidatus Woesebacteria bacterium GW2011_GWB1_43_14]
MEKTSLKILVLVLVIGAFLRLYRINEYMTFLGDEGRDVLIVRRFITKGDLMLVGPGTSIGNMYLGPLYYYLMAPALLIFFLSPVGPAVMVAMFGVATIGFVWLVAREWFPPQSGQISTGALTAAFLYAIAPTVTIFSRSSWNPNIMPFFALAAIYSIWKVWQDNKYKWLLVLGVSYAFVLQSHYLGLVLVPVLGFFWLLTFLEARRLEIDNFRNKTILGLIIFLFLMSPIVIFDARHGWRNFAAMKVFFFERQTTISVKPWKALPNMWPLWQEINTRLLAGRNVLMGTWTALGLIGGSVFVLRKIKLTNKEKSAFFLLFVWLGMALIGLGVYKQHIYDHYFGFFFPAPFLLFAGISQKILSYSATRGRWIVFTAFVLLTIFSLKENPLKYAPNKQLQRTKALSEKIIEESRGEPFNFAVIAERNYDDGYEFFMTGKGFTDIDPINTENTITEQLFVVCEMEKEKCDPTHSPRAEVANFGWSKIDQEWNVWGTTIFKLIHSQ